MIECKRPYGFRYRRQPRRKPFQRAIVLVELLALVAIIIFILAALTRLVVSQIDLHRVERQHHNRVATMEGFMDRLRGDLLAASEWTWRDGVLTMQVGDDEGVRWIEYRIEAERAARLVRVGLIEQNAPTTETDAWSSPRLGFEAALERGDGGAILTLTFVESPPPRRRLLPDRRYVVTLFLPRPAGDRSPADRVPAASQEGVGAEHDGGGL